MTGTANVDGLDRAALMDALVALAEAGGDIVWRHFLDGADVTIKPDESPVTAADHAAEAAILAGLMEVAPHIPVVAEEAAAAGRIPAVDGAFFLVDPLDGTKEFIRRGDDFTVNIGLIEQGAPTMGVVYAPARKALYWGDAASGVARRAERTPFAARGAESEIAVRPIHTPPCAVASRSHADPATAAWLDAGGICDCVSVGSSLKFVLVASGEADVYPRTGPTMEWDTAAGDAVLRAAGGRTLDPDNRPFRYGKPGFRNSGFIACGRYEPAPLRPFVTG
ncbi:3'(2'),5'-bisphosphate nucleotidase CysQ [uncultured Sphingomonas sp.]|uniref:3'(2'),5'-bisphosphate nucleotidase CysQ n=1 Tax=uncultured Sphingomonas sp. TaxID=158754 RepID=UPI002618CB67|nr:3'(2'),5'-bisphosphate nucleotidase CysQ [uncultured Sphingomonas sp.]